MSPLNFIRDFIMHVIQLITALGLLIATIGFSISVSLVSDSDFRIPNILYSFTFAVLGAIFLYLFLMGYLQ